jgi:hypothetical protein
MTPFSFRVIKLIDSYERQISVLRGQVNTFEIQAPGGSSTFRESQQSTPHKRTADQKTQRSLIKVFSYCAQQLHSYRWFYQQTYEKQLRDARKRQKHLEEKYDLLQLELESRSVFSCPYVVNVLLCCQTKSERFPDCAIKAEGLAATFPRAAKQSVSDVVF